LNLVLLKAGYLHYKKVGTLEKVSLLTGRGVGCSPVLVGWRGGLVSGRGGYGASVAEVGVLQVQGVGDLLRAASQVHLKAGG